MFTLTIGDTKVDAEVSFLTAQIYEAEFMSDLISDLNGDQRIGEGEFSFENGKLVGIDYTKVKWSAVMKALWAAVKTATPATSPYAQWVKEARGVNLWEVRDTLLGELSECFFRPETAEEGAEEEE